MTGLVQRASGFINLLKENGGEYFNEGPDESRLQ